MEQPEENIIVKGWIVAWKNWDDKNNDTDYNWLRDYNSAKEYLNDSGMH